MNRGLWNAPKRSVELTSKPCNSYPGQADKVFVTVQIIFWGGTEINFMASLPFDGMRQDFAASGRNPNGPNNPLTSFLKALN
jgi:hypothetical protein